MIKELELSENRHLNILKDKNITLTNDKSKQLYPNKLRPVAI